MPNDIELIFKDKAEFENIKTSAFIAHFENDIKIKYKFGNLRFLLSRKEYEGFEIDFHVPSEHAISIKFLILMLRK